MNAPAEEIVRRHPPVASKMTILPSEILPDPDLQLSPYKKGILRKETHRHKSQSNVRFDLRKHTITDLSVSASESTPADPSLTSNGSDTITDPGWSNIEDTDPADLCWRNSTNGTIADPDLRAPSNSTLANTNCGSSCNGNFTDTICSNTNNNAVIIPDWNNTKNTKSANPTLTSANNGASANPNVTSANHVLANPNVRSTNSGGPANPNVRSTNSGGPANPNVRSTNSGGPANPSVRSTNNTTIPANPSWHNNGYHGNPPVTQPDNWNNTYNGRLADLNRNSTTNGTTTATATIPAATTIPSTATTIPAAATAVWNTRAAPMPSGDPGQMSSYSMVPVDPPSISNGYPGTSLADYNNSSSDPTQAAALPAPALPQVALNSSQHILRKLNAFTHTSDAQLIKELHRQLNVDKKKEINEKAAAKVDYKADSVLYDNLISLDVPVVCVKKKKKKKKSAVRKKGAGDPAAPVAPFYDPSKENTHQEVGHFTLQGIPPPHVNLLQAPPSAAFTLYKHNRVWDNLPFHYNHHH